MREASPRAHASRNRSLREPPRRTLWVCAGLVAVVLLVYGRVLGHEFVNFDDEQYILLNPYVGSGLGSEGVKWAFTTSYQSNWHPLTWLSHMLDVELFGLRPGPHHLVSVILHAANAVLCFLALLFMTRAFWPSAFVAALFAVHPLRVESVAWASERKDVLSGLFFMLALLAYGRYAKRPGPGRYAVVFALHALGLMAKPMLVTLPVVLLLLDVWPLGRWSRSSTRVRLVVEKLPLLALSVASSVVTLIFQTKGGSVFTFEAVPAGSRFANALVSYASYLRKTLWPMDLAVLYPHTALLPPERASSLVAPAILSVLILVVVTGAVMRLGRRRPYLAVGWLWYLGMLLPVIGFVQVGIQAMADRYAYLPLVGIYLMVAWGARDFAARWPRAERLLWGVAPVILAAFAAAAWVQVGYWRDSSTLFRHALRVTENNYLVHMNVGVVLDREGKLDEAVREYERALAIKPDYAIGHFNLGSLLSKKGDLARAREQYEHALLLRPDHLEARNNLAVVLATQRDFAGAAAQYEAMLRLDPDYVPALYNLGIVLAQQGALERAAAQFERALRLDPHHAEAQNNLGTVLERQGRSAEAASRYETALRIQPDYFEACYNLGVIYGKQGKTAQAAAQFERALRIRPGHELAQKALASLRASAP